ncbi:MAG: hypothetical protein K2F95_05370 [Alistipes sp.]|nr:hypothetical protein [Alistipes sp.]MDE7128764.1 hypothetical protein [Alistipes sp.]
MKRIVARLWLWLIVAAAVYIVAAVIAGLGVRRHFDRGAVRVQAEVICVNVKHFDGYSTRVGRLGRVVKTPPRTEYTIHYVYSVKGERYEGSHVSSRVQPRIKAGSRITIEYAADKPSLSRMVVKSDAD